MIDDVIHRKPGEKVVYFLRRHPIVFVGDILLQTLLVALPIGIWFVLLRVWPAILEGAVLRPTLTLLGGGYYLMIWLFFFMNFTDYYLDAWIVTDDRILNIEQHSLFSRTVSELDLSNVQDVTSEVKGIFAYVFGFGDVYIQTAGEKERFVFEQVRHPEEVRKNMLRLVETDRKKQGEVQAPGGH
jgi:hypothetical protein